MTNPKRPIPNKAYQEIEAQVFFILPATLHPRPIPALVCAAITASCLSICPYFQAKARDSPITILPLLSIKNTKRHDDDLVYAMDPLKIAVQNPSKAMQKVNSRK